jgi:CRP-like cAMP-binding protein
VGSPHPDDFPSEFYIVLSGEVGIFPPRLDELINKESKVLETIKKVLSPDGSPLNVHIEQVLSLVDINRFSLEEREFLVNILRFDQSKVVFKVGYLRRKLGDLPDSALMAADFYHHVTATDQNGLLKYEKANSITKGGMFGEVALINGKNRNAHCVAMADTELGLLGIKEYDLILKKLQDQEHKFKRTFFERVVLKDQNLWDQAKSLMSYFEKKKYMRGQHLYRKGEVNQKVYIIT